jgi:hypothetical protein
MTMVPVQSASIRSIGHDPETSTLHVLFHSGETYAFHGVSAAKHEALMSSPSIGRHLNTVIKPGHKANKVLRAK